MGFFKTDIIDGSTINHVAPPVLWGLELPVLTLFVAGAAFVVLFVWLRRRAPRGAPRAFIYASVLAGVLFAARMDLNWLAALVTDVPAFAGKSIADRLYALTGHDLYVFTGRLKKDLPEGASVRTTDLPQGSLDSYKTKLGNYYLLPVMASGHGRFLWTFYFTDTVYDPATGLLDVYGRRYRARPYLVYGEGLEVYEILGGPL